MNVYRKKKPTTAFKAIPLLYLGVLLGYPNTASAGHGDAVIQYRLGLQALADEYHEQAATHFKRSCLDAAGVVEACLEWADLSATPREQSRALSAAVYLEPLSFEAHYRLGLHFLNAGDFAFAAVELEAAVERAPNPENAAWSRLALGYSLYQQGEHERALTQLKAALPSLDGAPGQQAQFYVAQIHLAEGRPPEARAAMARAAGGPDADWAHAAAEHLDSWSAFPGLGKIHTLASASLAVNTRPAASFIDESPEDSPSALQGLFRADALGELGSHRHRLYGSLTAYREQNFTTFGGDADEQTSLSPNDFNLTLFLLDLAYLRTVQSAWGEHQLRLGMSGDTQFLDGLPVEDETGEYASSGFGVYAYEVALKGWWTFAFPTQALVGVRLKASIRPDRLNPNRSAARFRVRLTGDWPFWNKRLRASARIGLRYDRTYDSPAIVQYDRLLPESELALRWQTPWRRLSVKTHGMIRVNVYPNARYDSANSFRPPYVEDPLDPDAETEDEYYDLPRVDTEWELGLLARVTLWPGGEAELSYDFRQRISNIDSAWVPGFYEDEEISVAEYGYSRHLAALLLRHRF